MVQNKARDLYDTWIIQTIHIRVLTCWEVVNKPSMWCLNDYQYIIDMYNIQNHPKGKIDTNH